MPEGKNIIIVLIYRWAKSTICYNEISRISKNIINCDVKREYLCKILFKFYILHIYTTYKQMKQRNKSRKFSENV